MIAFASVEIGTGGIAGCIDCAGAGRPSVAPRPLAEIRLELARVASGWESGPGPNVCFCEFEPFAHPELPQVIAAASTLGFRRIRLRTDARALSVPANATGVVAAGVTQIEVVLMGDARSHDRVVGAPGSFAAAIEGCIAFQDAGREAGVAVAVTGLVVACRHNVEGIAHAVAALAGVRAVAVGIDASALTARGACAVEAALETAATSGISGFVSGAPFPVSRPFGVSPWTMLGGDR